MHFFKLDKYYGDDKINTVGCISINVIARYNGLNPRS